MDLTPFKCYACKSLPEDDVLICSNKHIYCTQCAKESQNTCRCACDLEPSSNPLESALLSVNISCIYKTDGCTWKFAVKDLRAHSEECKYRPYVCVGNKLSVWKCSWKGLKYQVNDHFNESHSSRKTYTYSEEDKIPLFKDGEKVLTGVNLVDAFNKTFVFYYESNCNTSTVSFIIFLLGRKQDAKKYLYELEIMDSKDKHIRIKFTQACFSDTEDINQLINAGKCVSISQKVLENYVHDDFIHFRFRMSKREVELSANGSSSKVNAKKLEMIKQMTKNEYKYTDKARQAPNHGKGPNNSGYPNCAMRHAANLNNVAPQKYGKVPFNN